MTKWLMGIGAALIVGGIGGIVSMSLAGARADGETTARVTSIAARVEKHDDTLERLGKVLERVDERTEGMADRLERVESKQDEALKRKGK